MGSKGHVTLSEPRAERRGVIADPQSKRLRDRRISLTVVETLAPYARAVCFGSERLSMTC